MPDLWIFLAATAVAWFVVIPACFLLRGLRLSRAEPLVPAQEVNRARPTAYECRRSARERHHGSGAPRERGREPPGNGVADSPRR